MIQIERQADIQSDIESRTEKVTKTERQMQKVRNIKTES